MTLVVELKGDNFLQCIDMNFGLVCCTGDLPVHIELKLDGAIGDIADPL